MAPNGGNGSTKSKTAMIGVAITGTNTNVVQMSTTPTLSERWITQGKTESISSLRGTTALISWSSRLCHLGAMSRYTTKLMIPAIAGLILRLTLHSSFCSAL